MEEAIRLSVPTLFGLEGVAAAEMKRLGLQGVAAEDGRVNCDATLADIARLNVALRTGERVQICLGSFAAADFDALFEGVRALPWERFIPRDGRFPVKGYCLNSRLHSEPACQAMIKKAVAERLGRAYGLGTLPESGALYQIQFGLLRDRALLLLDTSGPALYKRGYRQDTVLAPLRETLAAGLVQLLHYRGQALFCDPHCGSGTICIEAALIARNRAPGLDRSFSAQKWACLPSAAWTDAAEEALDNEFDGEYHLWGGDTDPHALSAARRNAEAAGVEDIITWRKRDSASFSTAEKRGFLVTNPPYGERLLEKEQAEELYSRFGAACSTLGEDWRLGVICPHPEFETLFGRSAAKRRKLYNGKLRCQYYMYGV